MANRQSSNIYDLNKFFITLLFHNLEALEKLEIVFFKKKLLLPKPIINVHYYIKQHMPEGEKPT